MSVNNCRVAFFPLVFIFPPFPLLFLLLLVQNLSLCYLVVRQNILDFIPEKYIQLYLVFTLMYSEVKVKAARWTPLMFKLSLGYHVNDLGQCSLCYNWEHTQTSWSLMRCRGLFFRFKDSGDHSEVLVPLFSVTVNCYFSV